MGTLMSSRAVFFDRDDTLIEDPGYISSPDQVKLLPGVTGPLIELKSMGFQLVVVSNQSGIARGIFTEQTLAEIHDRLKELLAVQGACLDAIYYCPYHPEGVIEKYRKESDLRKPYPGMLLSAADDMGINLSESWMIGNSYRDTTAGHRAGCRTILLTPPGRILQSSLTDPAPDFKGVNLREAVNIIKKYQRQPSTPPVQPKPEPIKAPAPPPVNPEPVKPGRAAQQKNEKPGQPEPSNKTDDLLEEILKLLKQSFRQDMFGEFSITKLIAGCLQIVVGFFLFGAIWFLLNPGRNPGAVFVSLGFALVFQMMVLTLYLMQLRK